MIAVFKKIILSLYFLSIFSGTLLIDFPEAHAKKKFDAINSTEVASLFYKMIDKEPDFKAWASHSKNYKKAPDYDKEFVLQNEEIKLREIFYNVFVDELINVQVRITPENYSEIQEKFFFPEIGIDTFFAYGTYDRNFALIVPGIEQYSEISMPKEQAEEIKNSPGGLPVIELTLKPVHAESAGPIEIDGREYWAILCEIGAFRIWDAHRTRLYWGDYQDWYHSDDNLLDLYKK